MESQAAADMTLANDFWDRVREASDKALACGALAPIATTAERVVDGGVSFVVRLAEAPKPTTILPGPAVNPFLPYHPAAFVSFVSPTHVCLLNKFRVAPGHLLLVTRSYEPQENLLTLGDFDALLQCLNLIDGLGFYNSGPTAGASQPHKHLQFVPLPLAPTDREPDEPAPAQSANEPDVEPPIAALWKDEPLAPGEIGICRSAPFAHRLASLPESEPVTAADLLATYHRMLRQLRLWPEEDPSDSPSGASARGAYNLLATRRWMLVVPRLQETFASVSLNGLSYAGAILVRGQDQRRELLARGPMTALSGCAAAYTADADATGR